MYENPGEELYFGEVYRTALQEAWLPEGASIWQRTGISRRGRRPTQQGLIAHSPTELQATIRRCFHQCTEAWRSIPWSRDPDDPCTERLVKTEWWDRRQAAGVPCGYYDYYIRHCQQECIESGCIPANVYCLAWDPNNPEYIPQSSNTPVSVLGGIPPLTWTIQGSGFSLALPTTPGLSNTIISSPTSCGTAHVHIQDACNRYCDAYPLSDHGIWCTCYSHTTGGTPATCGPGEFSFHKGPLKITGLCASNGGLFLAEYDCLTSCSTGPSFGSIPPPNPCGGTPEECAEDGPEKCCRYWTLKIEILVCEE